MPRKLQAEAAQGTDLLPIMADTPLGLETSKHRTKATGTRIARRLLEVEKMDARQKSKPMQFLDTFIENAELKRQAHGAAPR